MGIRPLLFIFLISLIVRGLTAQLQPHPQTMDEAYSYINAVTLTEGRGFVEDFIWNYLNPPNAVTHPGNLYWMPLSSMIAWIGLSLSAPTYGAAQLGFIILSAMLPPLGYIIAWHTSRNERHAWVVALMMLWSGAYFRVWTTVDNFTPFALAGAFALFAAWQAMTIGIRWAIIAGVMVGLAHLARADGPLLLIAITFAWIVFTFTAQKPHSKSIHYLNLTKLISLLLLGYLAIMLPWFIRNIQVVGAPLAPGGSKTIWLHSYNDLFSVNQSLSWQSYLAWGWEAILQSKLWALGQNLQRLLGETGMIFALPLAIVGGWTLRDHALYQIAFIYFVLLFVAMTAVFTFPGPRGALFHSGGAILPFMFTAAIIGLDFIVAAIARRRPSWRAKQAKNVFSIGLVMLSIFLSVAMALPTLQQQPFASYASVVNIIPDQDATVMVGNPPAYLYFGGLRAIVTPNEPITPTLQVADRYGATFLVLDQHRPPLLDPYYSKQRAHPRLKLEATLDGPTYVYRILP